MRKKLWPEILRRRKRRRKWRIRNDKELFSSLRLSLNEMSSASEKDESDGRLF